MSPTEFDSIKRALLGMGFVEWQDNMATPYQYATTFLVDLPADAKDCCLNNKSPLLWLKVYNFNLAYAVAPDLCEGELSLSTELPNGIWYKASVNLSAEQMMDGAFLKTMEKMFVSSWNAAYNSVIETN